MRASSWRADGLLAWMLLAPSLALLGLFTYWPVVQVLWRSLVVSRYGQAPRISLENYARLFADQRFATALSNTALYAAGTVMPSVVLALLFALALQRRRWWTALCRTLLVLPTMVPLVAVAALFTFVFLPGQGLLDHHLMQIGFGATQWLGNPDLALPSIIAITIWKNTGYYMLFFLAGLAGVPQEALEAAVLDGAGAWARLRYVILPLLGPTLAFVAAIAAINVLIQVDHVLVMTGGPADSTNLLLSYIYQQAQQNLDVGAASAATVVSIAALSLIALGGLQALERGVHYES